ncbi:NAD(P)-binding protein [Xylariaceae sp. FL0662B]|nr:NAD(P)-binding protein [Xylariaceae sp. FL0662B]
MRTKSKIGEHSRGPNERKDGEHPAGHDGPHGGTGAAGGLAKVTATGYLDTGHLCDTNEARLARGSGARTSSRVNNAGMEDTVDLVGSTGRAISDRVIDANLTGSFLAAKAAGSVMEKQPSTGGTYYLDGFHVELERHGRPVGLYGYFELRFYPLRAFIVQCDVKCETASKHGVAGLVKNRAGFYGSKGIYAIGLLLGAVIDTNISDGTNVAIQLKDVAK